MRILRGLFVLAGMMGLWELLGISFPGYLLLAFIFPRVEKDY